MRKHLELIIVLALVGGCHGPEDGDVRGVLALDGTAAEGGQHFTTCAVATCHGADGKVGDGPNLAETVPEWNDEELAQIIKYGFGDMGGSELPDQAIADLMAYLRETYP